MAGWSMGIGFWVCCGGFVDNAAIYIQSVCDWCQPEADIAFVTFKGN